MDGEPAVAVNVPDILVVIPTLIASGAVTVTIPEDIGDTSKFAEKLIVPAVPIVDPSCSTITPEPEPTTPVKAEPSPLNCEAVTIPVTSIPDSPIVTAEPTVA